MEQEAMLHGMRRDFQSLERVQVVCLTRSPMATSMQAFSADALPQGDFEPSAAACEGRMHAMQFCMQRGLKAQSSPLMQHAW